MNNIQPHIILGKLLKNKLSSDDYGKYHYGNVNEIKELMRMSSVKGGLYPLIWCELPLTNPVQSPVGLTTNLKVFLATRSQKGWLNDERQIETFEKVLNPLYDKFCDILKKSDSFQVIDRQINRNDLPNFYTSEIGTRDNQEKNQVEEYWDVVTLDFRAIVMGGKCEVEPIAPVNTDITLDFDYEDLGNNEYRLFWSTQNAYRVYLNNEIVSNNGEKFVTVNDEEKGTFTLFAYNKDYKTSFETIIIDNTSVDPRVTYANRIGEDGGSIVGFDLLEDEINTPVGRKEGKLYAYNEDDYTVIRNGGAWEFTRDGVYKEVGVDIPRFDWSNGKQELLVGGQATNLFTYSEKSNNFTTAGRRNCTYSDTVINEIGLKSANEITSDVFTSDYIRSVLQYTAVQGEDRYISIHIKKKQGWFLRFTRGNATSSGGIGLDLSSGNILYKTGVSNDFTEVEYLGDWLRVLTKFEGGSDSTFGLINIDFFDNQDFLPYNNAGGEKFLITGIQLEKNKASSYIQTNGSIVTRPADIITNSQGQLAPGRYDTV